MTGRRRVHVHGVNLAAVGEVVAPQRARLALGALAQVHGGHAALRVGHEQQVAAVRAGHDTACEARKSISEPRLKKTIAMTSYSALTHTRHHTRRGTRRTRIS